MGPAEEVVGAPAGRGEARDSGEAEAFPEVGEVSPEVAARDQEVEHKVAQARERGPAVRFPLEFPEAVEAAQAQGQEEDMVLLEGALRAAVGVLGEAVAALDLVGLEAVVAWGPVELEAVVAREPAELEAVPARGQEELGEVPARGQVELEAVAPGLVVPAPVELEELQVVRAAVRELA